MDVVDHLVDDPAQVGVVAGDHPHDEVADPGDRVDFEHLGNRGQVGDYRRMTLPLANLQRAESGHGVAEGPRVDVRSETLDDPALDQAVQTGLHRAARHSQATTGAEHPDVGILGEKRDQARVQVVDAMSRGHTHIVEINPP